MYTPKKVYISPAVCDSDCDFDSDCDVARIYFTFGHRMCRCSDVVCDLHCSVGSAWRYFVKHFSFLFLAKSTRIIIFDMFVNYQ